MFCKIKALENISLNNLHDTFVEKAATEGKVQQIKLSKEQEELAKDASDAKKVIKKQLKDKKQEAILNAEPITDSQYAIFKEVSESISDKERLSLKRKNLMYLIGELEEYLPDAIKNENRMFKAVYLQGLFKRDIIELEELDKKEFMNNIVTDRKYRVRTRRLLEEFLIEINYHNSVNLGEKLKPSNPLFGWAQWFKDRRVEFKQLLNLNVPKDIDEKPMLFIQTVLEQLGLKYHQQAIQN